MFNLKDFILKGLKDAVGKMADFQVILNAVGWHEKGVLTESDLEEINVLIEAENVTQQTDNEEIGFDLAEEVENEDIY